LEALHVRAFRTLTYGTLFEWDGRRTEGPMSRAEDDEWLNVLRRALDAVETGVVVLSADLQRLLLANAAADRMIGRVLTTALRRMFARVGKTRARGERRSVPCLVMVRRVPRWVSLQRLEEPLPIEVALIDSAEGDEQTLADLDIVELLAEAASNDAKR
jgi:hypothetical protein